mmetsp:Transcript_6061/g.19303  ORF Transcript_6061/g.19303 Transcript_6061/m.19303 type:complete len:298 (+) Transcript_6061:575-1468(+)
MLFPRLRCSSSLTRMAFVRQGLTWMAMSSWRLGPKQAKPCALPSLELVRQMLRSGRMTRSPMQIAMLTLPCRLVMRPLHVGLAVLGISTMTLTSQTTCSTVLISFWGWKQMGCFIAPGLMVWTATRLPRTFTPTPISFGMMLAAHFTSLMPLRSWTRPLMVLLPRSAWKCSNKTNRLTTTSSVATQTLWVRCSSGRTRTEKTLHVALTLMRMYRMQRIGTIHLFLHSRPSKRAAMGTSWRCSWLRRLAGSAGRERIISLLLERTALLLAMIDAFALRERCVHAHTHVQGDTKAMSSS